jgi:iron complex transport system substrate-binding protein
MGSLRIASLISSGTEILCKLGLEDQIVGISHECDYPPSLTKRQLPVLSAPKIDPGKTSREIDRDVRALVSEGLSVYKIHTEILEALAPDIIVTQDQCEVCAVSLKDVEEAVCKITKRPTRICSLKPHTLDDIVTDFRKVGEATDRKAQAEDLVNEFWLGLNAVNAKAGTKDGKKPTMLCIEWIEPTIIAGGWIPEIVRLAGGEPLIVTGPDRFKTVSWEEAVSARPDVVAILPCGYGLEKTREELLAPAAQIELKKFAAAQKNQVFLCDGNNYFNRPGPRIVDSCQILAALLHPSRFENFKKTFEGKGYIKWQS